MIGLLRGTLLHKRPPFLVLDVGGVGYEMEAPMNTFYDLPDEGDEVALFTHLLVREDAQLLFGFSDRFQREFFRNLLKVSGVGARVGLSILSTLTVNQFVQCVRMQDSRALTSVPGIGKKTAERMLLEMRDRIDRDFLEEMADFSSPSSQDAHTPVEDAIGALVALGYRHVDATRAIRAVEGQTDGRDDLIRQALQWLSRR